MKTKANVSHRLLRVCSLATVFLCSAFLGESKEGAGYVAHEWGTFTSVQGGSGELLVWRPLETSQLPGFVYNWQHPGLGRQGLGDLAYGKGSMVTLQRMETPVIYFYSAREQMVDVSVKFPKGLITEWYPQTTRVGPSTAKPSPVVAELDKLAHKAGTNPRFSFGSLFNNPAMKESGARWGRVDILPSEQSAAGSSRLLGDRSGSHYFSARETDANCLQVDSLTTTNLVTEREKFLFYRGVGNFPTPLRVKMDDDGAITLENTGEETLSHLFVLGLEGRIGQFVYIANLAPGEQRQIQLRSLGNPMPLDELSTKLSAQIAGSLVQAGLFRREAQAMIKTWKDSWLEEDGVRVLFLLPRRWTDQTLPLALDPAPSQLVRVLVGRSEILTPMLESRLTLELRRVRQGDPTARTEMLAQIRKLGRFADPAMRLALVGGDSEFKEIGWNLFQLASQPAQ